MIVILVRADPDPFDYIPDDLANGAVVVAHPNREPRIAATLELFER